MSQVGEKLLELIDVKKYYPVRGGFLLRTVGQVRAVDGVALQIRRGETLAIVGESGCGKSTLAQIIAGLIKPTNGKIIFNGVEIKDNMLHDILFRHKIQMVFQNPESSLNPRMTVRDVLAEAIKAKYGNTIDEDALNEKILNLVNSVGLTPQHLTRYPHQLSGGEKQRVSIARALATDPELIILDEPVSALDLSMRAQILNLLLELQQRHYLTYIYITHNLEQAWHLSDRVAVMYLGKIVELAPTETFFHKPLHPYSMVLLSSAPLLEASFEVRKIKPIGEPPSPLNPPKGCRFHPRCPFAFDRCREMEPRMLEVEEGHWVACYLAEESSKLHNVQPLGK
ncbi:MAG: ATP-binding cassette domain-containing protein [Candidatus Caldarchaeum sp.]